MSITRKNRILVSILLLISMMISGGVGIAQAAPTFNESPVILTGMGITFNGSPTRKIDWTSYDGYAMTAGTATNAGNANTTDGVHIGTTTVGKWCTTDGTTINCTSDSPLMSFTELDPSVSAWAKAATKPSYTFNEIGSGSIGATTGYFSGNVGIGKTAPGFALDVNGVVNATALYVGGAAYIGSQWITTSTSIYYNTGNVGIGTTAPLSNLHVYGNTNGGVSLILQNAANNTAASTGLSMGPGAGSNLNIITYPSSHSTRPSSILINSDSGVTNGILIAPDAGGVNISGAGPSNRHLSVVPAGNVGIGLTNPGTKLDVSGSLRATSGTITALAPGGLVMSDASGNLYATSTAVATGLPTPVGIGGQTLRSNGTNWIANNLLYNDGTNVGIGTANPGSKLDIVATDTNNAPITSTNYLNAGGVLGRRANGTIASPTALVTDDMITAILARGYNGSGFTTVSNAGVYIYAGENWTTTKNGTYLTFGTTANGGTNRTEKLRITGDGNVGIGTTAPSAALDVNGNAILTGANRNLQISNSGYAHIYFQNTSNSIKFDANQFQFNTTQTQGFTFNGGNVGIGTTAPTDTLHVNGIIYSNNLAIGGNSSNTGERVMPILGITPYLGW